MPVARSKVRSYEEGEVERGKDPSTGKFVKGNTLGRGQLVQRRAKHYLDLISKCVTDDDMKKIVKRAVRDAKQGNDRARKWISEHLIGRDPSAQILFLAQGTSDPDLTVEQCKDAVKALKHFRAELEKSLKLQEEEKKQARDVEYEISRDHGDQFGRLVPPSEEK